MKKLFRSFLLSTTFVAFDNAGWKLDADGHIILKDGNPVFVDTAGNEKVVEGGTITRLNGEARSHREAKEAAEEKLKAFDGIDPAIAKKSIETVGKLDAKKLIDSGDVDKLTNQIKEQFTGQLTEKDKALETANSRIDGLLIDKVFDGSQFVRDRVAVPVDMFQASFRSNFKVEDGKVVAYGKDGNKLLSKARAGEYATPEEALELLVESHPQKDTIVKAAEASGSGSNGGGGGRGQGRNIKRSEWEKQSPADQAATMAKVRSGEMTLTD